MAKKVEEKRSAKDIIDIIIRCLEYAIIPISTMAGYWGFDISVYTSAIVGCIVNILVCVKLFLK